MLYYMIKEKLMGITLPQTRMVPNIHSPEKMKIASRGCE